jgi:hypothetical protein
MHPLLDCASSCRSVPHTCGMQLLGYGSILLRKMECIPRATFPESPLFPRRHPSFSVPRVHGALYAERALRGVPSKQRERELVL